ncbi:NADP-dependent malic enzyme [Vaginella massiliensis]|uniref:NADP-dependent malic enzyme n=1 Tax=Vaginella massiliensis TaxID=1816680 RepID=UPI000838B26A|nr:NADP-dependent malic enzyme [Vaginella massiliensis]
MKNNNRKQDALHYHSMGKPGKIAVVPTKPTNTQRDLSLAYSPGVAEPCLEIEKNPENAYQYTAKGNLVAVISNGTAVLGLGDIGAQASKPVMEGKGLLFKIFADIDVFDIELDTKNVEEFIQIVKVMQPTFGGVNLEDIKAPECFEIERRLKEELDIPVMHDDQHGTAIISGAALINACELQGKRLDEVMVVVNGAGAAAISCTAMYESLGVKRENIVMLDSKGVIRKDNSNLPESKATYATSRDLYTLEDAIKDADVFIGLSAADVLSPEMLLTMADKPIVFAMANPNPEISYDLATATRQDVVMATGRSDYPNQVNNVLGFPYIFRGALDVRATTINEEMKIAAVYAIAELAKQSVPEEVSRAYNNNLLKFGKEYIIPKPNDPRLLTEVSSAVAKAAMETGVAKSNIEDWAAYKTQLVKRLGKDNPILRNLTATAKSNPKKVVFVDGDRYEILRAAQIVKEEGIAEPIILGRIEKVKKIINDYLLELDDVEIIDPYLEQESEQYQKYAQFLYEKRQRKGVTLHDARKLLKDRNYFAACMVEFGEADTLISGMTRNYSASIRPALEIIGARDHAKVSSMYMMLTDRGAIFMGDTTVNVNPNAQELVDIALQLNESIRKLNITPRIAMLSYSNFGSNGGETPTKVQEAVRILHEQHPEVIIDGDIQANFAVNKEKMQANFPFCKLKEHTVNTLVFPNLESANMSYKLLQELGNIEAVGPILLGMKKPIHLLQLDSSVREIVNMVTIAVIDAQTR